MAKRLHTYHVMLILSVFMIFTTECFDGKTLKARRKSEFDSLFEEDGAVADLISRSLIRCFDKCFENLKCLTFFYNSDTGRCVMHSRDFIYLTPGVNGTGWKFYVTEDVSGRCPPQNYYYRYLDFCYTVERETETNFAHIKAACTNKGSNLSPVTNQEFQDYFTHFLEGKSRVCIAGTVRANETVQLDDGSMLSYYNWNTGQPDQPGTQECLVMRSEPTGYVWHDADCISTNLCVSVCEMK